MYVYGKAGRLDKNQQKTRNRYEKLMRKLRKKSLRWIFKFDRHELKEI